MPTSGRINVFYSYAREDEAYRDRLVKQLQSLRDDDVISEWYDRMIEPGIDWKNAIEENQRPGPSIPGQRGLPAGSADR